MEATTTSNETIKLGDIVQRVSIHLFEEMKVLMSNMKSLTPELRTIKLRALVSRSKKCLADVLALCKWLESADVLKHFASINQMNFQIGNVDGELNEIQDGLYFTHRDLFAKRIRPINIKMARDILARGTYFPLPVSISTCGRMPSPGNQEENIIRKELDLYIRAKLFLVDEIPTLSFPLTVSIQNGVLHIVAPLMYELLVSLQYPDENAPWNIIGLKFLVQGCSKDFTEKECVGFDLMKFECDVLQKIRDLLGMRQTIEKFLSTDLRTRTQAMSDVVSLDNCGASPEIGTQPDCNVSLKRIISICNHASEAVQLRMLYWQGLQLKRSGIWNDDSAELSYMELENCSLLSLKLWPVRERGEYKIEIIIRQFRKSSVLRTNEGGLNLQVDIISLVRSGSPASDEEEKYHEKIRKIQIGELINCNLPEESQGPVSQFYRRKVEILTGADFLRSATIVDGVSIPTLRKEVMMAMSSLKMMVFAARILVTIYNLPALNKVFTLYLSDDSISVISSGTNIAIELDATSAHVLVSSSEFNVLEQASGILEAFQSELNNTFSDQQFAEFIWSSAMDYEVHAILLKSISSGVLKAATSMGLTGLIGFAEAMTIGDDNADFGIRRLKYVDTLEGLLQWAQLRMILEVVKTEASFNTLPSSEARELLRYDRFEQDSVDQATTSFRRGDERIYAGYHVESWQPDNADVSENGISYSRNFPHSVLHNPSGVANLEMVNAKGESDVRRGQSIQSIFLVVYIDSHSKVPDCLVVQTCTDRSGRRMLCRKETIPRDYLYNVSDSSHNTMRLLSFLHEWKSSVHGMVVPAAVVLADFNGPPTTKAPETAFRYILRFSASCFCLLSGNSLNCTEPLSLKFYSSSAAASTLSASAFGPGKFSVGIIKLDVRTAEDNAKLTTLLSCHDEIAEAKISTISNIVSGAASFAMICTDFSYRLENINPLVDSFRSIALCLLNHYLLSDGFSLKDALAHLMTSVNGVAHYISFLFFCLQHLIYAMSGANLLSGESYGTHTAHQNSTRKRPRSDSEESRDDSEDSTKKREVNSKIFFAKPLHLDCSRHGGALLTFGLYAQESPSAVQYSSSDPPATSHDCMQWLLGYFELMVKDRSSFSLLSIRPNDSGRAHASSSSVSSVSKSRKYLAREYTNLSEYSPEVADSISMLKLTNFGCYISSAGSSGRWFEPADNIGSTKFLNLLQRVENKIELTNKILA